MKLVWLRKANANRIAAIARIAEEDPGAARDQLDEITRQTIRLMEYPELGRPGRQPDTRELSIVRTPFLIVYRIRPKAQRIEILRFLHSRQQWPEK